MPNDQHSTDREYDEYEELQILRNKEPSKWRLLTVDEVLNMPRPKWLIEGFL
jgi:hypothetical protein